MDFSGMMSELQGVGELISCFVATFYFFKYFPFEGDDRCVKRITKLHHIQGMSSIIRQQRQVICLFTISDKATLMSES